MELFVKTKEVLEEYAKELVRLYKQRLTDDGKVASGNLVNSVNFIIESGNNIISVSLSLADYWVWVERGRAAGKFPPIDNILNWIRVKAIVPDERNGRVPDENQLAFLIARSIAGKSPNQANLKNPEGGIKAGNQLKETQEDINERWMKRIEDAVTEDIANELDAILTFFVD